MDLNSVRGCIAILALVPLALFMNACDQPAPTSDGLPQGVYDDQELDHFFADAERVLGGRISWTEIGDVKDLKQVVRVGAVDMTNRDRTQLQETAPQWIEVDAFETEYSERELERFGRDAMAALELMRKSVSAGKSGSTRSSHVREDRQGPRRTSSTRLNR